MTTNSKKKYLLAGLGNPGKEYIFTPHNAGFLFIDYLCQNWNISLVNKKKEESLEFLRNDIEIHCIKPLQFINLSGDVLCAYMKKNNLTLDTLIVIHDEVELPGGQWSWKQGGGHKGHNGLRNIIACLGNDFTRIRIGVERPTHKQAGLADYLLSPMNQELRAKITSVFPTILSNLEQKIFSP